MKHVLTFLCTAFLLFLTIDEAAASLLLNNNPTPPSIELDPAFVSGEGYQLAKVTWLPDYLGNNKSHGGRRVDDGGKDVGDSNCEKYGYVGSCGDGQTGTEVSVAGLTCYKNCKAVDCKEYGLVSEADCPAHKKGSGIKHPVSGLTCYEKCICDTSYYKYSSSNCASPKILGGEHCEDMLTAWKDGGMIGEARQFETVTGSLSSTSGTRAVLSSVPASAALSTGASLGAGAAGLSSAPTFGGVSLGDRDSYENQRAGNFTTCTCPAAYNLSVCPANANCKQCDSKYKFVDCQEGFTASGNTCVKTENCSAYPLTVCPTGGICSKCPDNTAKLKLDSCDTSKGWKISGNTCAAVDCSTGYTRGVTSCTSGSTKPDYTSNGWSGGLPCGLCKCSNVNSNCTAANYPLTSKSDSNANYSSCTTGCGSEKVTRYKITGCKANYKLVGGVCKSDVCTSGEKSVTCSSSQNKVVASTTDAGTACYKCENAKICMKNITYVSSALPVENGELCRHIDVEGSYDLWNDAGDEGFVTVNFSNYIQLDNDSVINYRTKATLCSTKYIILCDGDPNNITNTYSGDSFPIQGYTRKDFSSSANYHPLQGALPPMTTAPLNVMTCSTKAKFKINCNFTYQTKNNDGDELETTAVIERACEHWPVWNEGITDEAICNTLIHEDNEGCQYLEDDKTETDNAVCKKIVSVATGEACASKYD